MSGPSSSWVLTFALLISIQAGCLEEPGVLCGNGRICPEGTQCHEELGLCLRPGDGFCGDGIRNGTEVCDGDDVGALDCTSFGWQAGTLTCSADCAAVVTSGCTGFCGDGVVNGNEQCDGLDQPGLDCSSFNFLAGPLGCSASCQPTFDRCLIGPRRVPSPTPAGMQAMWGTGPGDVWAVGSNRSVFENGEQVTYTSLMHYDGDRWSEHEIDASAGLLNSVWGSSPDDFWAVGPAGIMHYDGASWTKVDTGLVASPSLRGVWGSGPDDVWVVGVVSNLPPARGIILHYDGTAWVEVDVDSGPAPRLIGVWGSGPDDVWAVGPDGIVRYDGQIWRLEVSPPEVPSLVAIWGSSPDDVWAVGPEGIVRYDGDSWSLVEEEAASAISGTRADDVWAVGLSGKMLRFDGTRWRRVDPVTTKNLRGVWGAAPDDLWATGAGGVLVRVDGLGFTVVDVFDPDAPPNGGVEGVWASSPTDVWIVSSGAAPLAGAHRYDGRGWTAWEPPAGLNSEQQRLTGIWGSGSDNVWAVGIGGSLLHFDGVEWSGPVPEAEGRFLVAIWGSGPDDVWVIGTQDFVLHFDGSEWKEHETGGPPSNFSEGGVWSSGPDDVWIVGFHAIEHFDGESWDVIESPALLGVWGSGRGDVWAVGEFGTILHWDGARWLNVPSPTLDHLYAVWGTDPGDVWAAGEDGALLHFDGSSWSRVRNQDGVTFLGLAGTSRSDVWVVGRTDSGGQNPRIMLLSHPMPALSGGACEAPIPAYCEATLFGNTTGRPNRFGDYDCPGTRDTPGGEVYYRLESPVTGTLELELSPYESELDLVVLGALAGGGCDPTGTCLAATAASPGAQESVTVEVRAGATYYLVVDGPGAGSAYTLSVGCTKL